MDNKEDSMLIAAIEDKLRQCEDQYSATNTQFLDPRQCALAESRFAFSKHLLWGGFEDAERRVIVFLPDYMDELSEDDDPLALLRVTSPKGSKKLTHRDYLGSLLGLGIDRAVTGDILVREDGADIVVLKSISEFLLANYSQAGRNSLRAQILPVSEIRLASQNIKQKRDTVASLRLDSVVSSAFGLSRGKAQDAVAAGLVFVNGLQTVKADRPVEEGDRIVLRGMGKAVLRGVGGQTRKDRTQILIDKYE